MFEKLKRTAEVLRRLMHKAHFAAVYAKPMGKPLNDTYAEFAR
jgi:adenine/guanine phosphoribosyltransferase-like PRPP-binding protein